MEEQKFQIFVDEPWDYNHKYGVINGKIVHVISAEMVFFQSDEPREFQGCSGRIFRLKTRYVGDELDLKKKGKLE